MGRDETKHELRVRLRRDEDEIATKHLRMRSVFSRSISAIFSQFAIRLSVPSALTTSGPRWSRRRAAPPTSRVCDGPSASAAAAGRAGSGAVWEDVSGCVVLLLLLLLFSGLVSGAAMVGDGGDEDGFEDEFLAEEEEEYGRCLDLI